MDITICSGSCFRDECGGAFLTLENAGNQDSPIITPSSRQWCMPQELSIQVIMLHSRAARSRRLQFRKHAAAPFQPNQPSATYCRRIFRNTWSTISRKLNSSFGEKKSCNKLIHPEINISSVCIVWTCSITVRSPCRGTTPWCVIPGQEYADSPRAVNTEYIAK